MTIGFRNDSSRSIVMLDGVDRVAFNEDGSMELLTPAANPTGNKVMTVSQMPFTKEYISGELAIVAGAATNLTPNLGATPKLVQLSVICKTAELGCSVGEEINIGMDGNGNSYGVAMYRQPNNIRLVVGVAGIYLIRADGSMVTLTLANWRLIVRAWV